ncbi:LOB domain-containing protein 20-like [Solanum pennellii]|uniref:LOB domain-containing protein 20-like n=1 Tax=Solanum pennellii TaxID=28526 RepID=A0ABM1H812_SOLPN|nr:LOB domain-containing protein 20-like [Solanum pennellii]
MDERPSDGADRRKGPGKRVSGAVEQQASGVLPASTAPCGACKFLRRKCINGCVFAPYFGSDQGAARFAAVHKVFGASNVSKLLLHIPANRRQDAVVTITYEAQARLSDPVFGCVSTILALQQQVASLQSELAIVQTQVMNSRYAMANAYHNISQEQHIAILQPSYSNNSSISNNNINLINNFNNSTTNNIFDHQLHGSVTCTANNSPSFDPIHQLHEEEEEEEEESHNPLAFTNHMFHSL